MNATNRTPRQKPPHAEPKAKPAPRPLGKCLFEGYGEEMIEKKVKPSGNSGRVYVPPEWVGKQVKVIRLD